MFFKISWSKAVWLEGNIEEVGTVPTLWIENEYIRWPVGVNALRTMAEQKTPGEKWKSFPLVKVQLSSGNIFFLYE